MNKKFIILFLICVNTLLNAGNFFSLKKFKIKNKTDYTLNIRLAPVTQLCNSQQIATPYLDCLYEKNGKYVFIEPDTVTGISLHDERKLNNVSLLFSEASQFILVAANTICGITYSGSSKAIDIKDNKMYIVTSKKIGQLDNGHVIVELFVKVE